MKRAYSIYMLERCANEFNSLIKIRNRPISTKRMYFIFEDDFLTITAQTYDYFYQVKYKMDGYHPSLYSFLRKRID